MPNNIETLYNSLAEKNPQLKSAGLEAFTNQLKDDNNLNTLYNKLS